LRGFRLRDGSRRLGQGGGGSRERHLLSDVLLNSLQCRNILGHLFLPGGELFNAASHGIEIKRQGLK
jgi:hypothetical protein